MGFKDLFRSKKTGAGAPQPAPGAPAQDPREQAGQADGQQPRVPDTAQGRGQIRAAVGQPEAAPFPPEGPLHNLVEILTSRGADHARLTLVQSGNIMTHQTRQATGGAQDEVENGTVDQGSPLFGDVADLYTEAMNTPRGPWRQLDLTVAPGQDGQRLVTVAYAFPDGQTDTERYVRGDAAGAAVPAGAGETSDDAAAGAAQPATAAGEERETAAPGTEDAAERTAPATTGSEDAGRDGSVRVVDGSAATPAADGQVVTGHEAAAPATEADGTRTADAQVFDTHAAETQLSDTHAADTRLGDAQPAEGTAAPADPVQGVATEEPASETIDGAEHTGERSAATAEADRGAELPDHLDESEFGDPDLRVAPAAPTGAAAAATVSEDDPADAPQLALSTDVAPSYSTPAAEPSPDAPAPGNLVLTVGDVQSRMGEAQQHLFGVAGTARDVSTVLIRVRALGSYYDALTHVRMNGFWDQRPTFDLVPEDLLKVQELKDDSYVEGSGAPLAVMFRFRPGVPPEVSFDYSDEEAFVRYEQRLPGQNYLEELRMYPRTGSNIPQHMNDALQDWNY